MKKLLLLWLSLASALAIAQTSTITGTIKDLTGAAVTSGQITFTLRPSADATLSGLARFTGLTVTCLISGAGQVVASDGVSACTITMNTSLQPQGSGYQVQMCPENVCTATFYMYAVVSSIDISTVISTPSQLPSQGGIVDTFSTQTIDGSKTFADAVTLPFITGPSALDGNFSVSGSVSDASESVTGAVAAGSVDNNTATENLGDGAPCVNLGDSITAGYYAQPQNGSGNIYSTNGYALLLDAAKGWTCSDLAISGTALMDPNISQYVFTTPVAQNQITTIMIGTNDFHNANCTGCSGGMSTSTAQTQWEQGFTAIHAWRGIPDGAYKVTGQNCPTVTTAPLNCTFSGPGWTNSPAWGGSVAKLDTNVGDTVTIQFSGTSFYFFYINQYNNASTFTLTVDGVPVPDAGGGTFSNAGYISQTILNSIQYSPAVYRFAGLAPGGHTVVMTTASVVEATYFAGFAVPDGNTQRTGPYVYTSNLPRAQALGYTTFGGSDAIVGQFDQRIRDSVNKLASDGLHIKMVDAVSIMNPANAALWWTDGFHPSTAGHAALAQAWEDATTAVALPSDRGSGDIFRSLNIHTTNQSLSVGGSPLGIVRGDIGSAEGQTVGCHYLGLDGGNLCRSGNVFSFSLPSGSPQVNAGSVAAGGGVSSYAANQHYLVENGGVGYFISSGANTSTKGGFDWRGTTSNNGSFTDFMTLSAAGLQIAGGAAIANSNAVPQVGTPTLNQAACIKAAGPPVVIGYCTTVVSSSGACTCN